MKSLIENKYGLPDHKAHDLITKLDNKNAIACAFHCIFASAGKTIQDTRRSLHTFTRNCIKRSGEFSQKAINANDNYSENCNYAEIYTKGYLDRDEIGTCLNKVEAILQSEWAKYVCSELNVNHDFVLRWWSDVLNNQKHQYYMGSKLNFEEWLAEQDLSIASIKKYAGAIKGPISDWAIEANLLKKSIIDIEDKEDFLDVKVKIENLPFFVERNTIGRRMYSSALNHYEKYLSDENINRVEVDVDNILFDPNTSEADKKSLVKTRLGQGKYRRQLLEIWNSKCSVTLFDNPNFLIASHIKPWSKSELKEKRDPYNGLLLIPNLDKAFDNGLITFKENGEIVISTKFSNHCEVGITTDLSLTMKDQNRRFLEFHQEYVFKV